MTPIKPDHNRLYDLAAQRYGLFTASEARQYGFGKQLIAHHVRNGRFDRVARGVYRFHQFPLSPLDDVVAAWLTAGRDLAVVSHESALAVHRLGPVNPSHVHLTLPRSARGRINRSGAGVRFHTATKVPLTPRDITRRADITLTKPARAIAESAAAGSPPDLIEAAVREALAQGVTSPHDLQVAARPFGHRVRQLIRSATENRRQA